MVVIGPPRIGQQKPALPYTTTDRPRYRLPRQTERLLEVGSPPRGARASSAAGVSWSTAETLAARRTQKRGIAAQYVGFFAVEGLLDDQRDSDEDHGGA
jgi:hypothetical protein